MAIITCSMAFAANPLTAVDENLLEHCTKEVFLSYFPEPLVNEVLREYNIQESLWPEINNKLKEQDLNIINTVLDKASSLSPNPLDDDSKRDVVISIFRESLYEAFFRVMKEYGIDNEQQIRAMLDQIQYMKGKAFKQCMEKQINVLEMHVPAGEAKLESIIKQNEEALPIPIPKS